MQIDGELYLSTRLPLTCVLLLHFVLYIVISEGMREEKRIFAVLLFLVVLMMKK